MEGYLMFQWGVWFSDGVGGFIFKWGGAPCGGIDFGGGGGGLKKIVRLGGHPPCPPTGKPCFGDLRTNVEFSGFLWFCEFLKVSASIFWLKTVLTLNYVFLLILNIFQGESSEKTFYVQINRWYWCKKDQKNFPQTSHKFFSQCLIVNSSLLWAFIVQNFCKNSFSGVKSRKTGIPVIKMAFSLQKIPQNYRLPWVNTNTIKYTCRFNTS